MVPSALARSKENRDHEQSAPRACADLRYGVGADRGGGLAHTQALPCRSPRGRPARSEQCGIVCRRHRALAEHRAANDSDWQPAKDAGKTIAWAEDSAIFIGYSAGGIQGIRQGTSNPIDPLPPDIRNYPDAIAHSISVLRLVGVNGPYSVLLGAEAYTAVAEARDYGYPVLEHLRRIVDGEIIWAPAIAGAFVLSTRGGDFDLHVGQDFSIGYSSHTDTTVRLYLQESFTFLLLTAEAAVALAPATAA